MISKKETEETNGKIVYIIGAGASKGDGIPLLNDIKDALKKLICTPLNDSRIDTKKLKNAYDFWQDRFPDQNIEKVMTYLFEEDKKEGKHELLRDFEYLFLAVTLYNKILNPSKEKYTPSLKETEEILREFSNFSIDYLEIDDKKINETYEFWKNNFPDKSIEEVITYLSEKKHLLLEDFEYSYAAVIIYYSYYYDFYRCIRKHPKSYSQTYVQFLRRVLLENAKIISLNVDNLICDCIRWDEKLNDELFNKMDTSNKENFETISVGGRREIVSCLTDKWPFKFYRIHGSVSFPNYKEGKGNDITISPQSNFQDLKNGKFRIEFPNFKKDYKKHPEFYNCSDSIKKAKKIVIIGHSFPESDNKWISNFKESVAQNTNNPEIEIVNPSVKDDGELIKNYLRNIPQQCINNVKLNPATFEEYLTN